MKLITKAIENQLIKHPMYSTDGNEIKDVVVKFFNPCGMESWYVVEGQKLDDVDWEFYGYVDSQFSGWGYFMLSQLASIKTVLGIGIERDMYFSKKKIDIHGKIL